MQREHQKQQHGSNGTVFSFAMVPHKNYTDVAGTGPGAPRGAAFGSPRSKGPDGDPRSTKRRSPPVWNFCNLPIVSIAVPSFRLSKYLNRIL